MNQLTEIYNLPHFLLAVPVILLITGSLLKWPVLPTIVLTTIFSIALGCLLQGFDLKNGILATTTGFKVSMTHYLATPTPAVKALLNRGGMMGVLENMGMLCVAMAFGGIMHGSGMLTVVLKKMLNRVRTDGGLIISTLLSCVVLCSPPARHTWAFSSPARCSRIPTSSAACIPRTCPALWKTPPPCWTARFPGLPAQCI